MSKWRTDWKACWISDRTARHATMEGMRRSSPASDCRWFIALATRARPAGQPAESSRVLPCEGCGRHSSDASRPAPRPGILLVRRSHARPGITCRRGFVGDRARAALHPCAARRRRRRARLHAKILRNQKTKRTSFGSLAATGTPTQQSQTIATRPEARTSQ
eukprot:COSAG02_NODE_738_length_17838_cov_10.051412_18_plen_162_part_00